MAQPCTPCSGTGRKTTKQCRNCSGRGMILQTESLKVKIPVGADTGSHIRLKGMGAAGHGSGWYGDLQWITVRPHPLFTRKEDDIYLDLPITFGEAALGAKIEIPTMEGGTLMTLPPGTQSGQKFKLSGKGFPSSKTGRRGNQFVTIKVAVPKNLSEQEKSVIQDSEPLYKETPRKGMVRK